MFSKEIFGLDISDASIEAVQLKKGKNKPKLIAFGRRELEPGILENGEILDKYRLSEAIKELLSKTFPKPITATEAIVGLPEVKVFTYILKVPKNLSHEQVKNALPYEMEGIIPFSKEDIYWDFKIIYKNEEGQEVFYAACPRKTIVDFHEVLKEADLFPTVFEAESLATARALIEPKSLSKETGLMLADIGARVTVLSIFDKNGIRSSVIVPAAGNKFTEIVAQKLGVSPAEAERLKRTYGLKLDSNSSLPKIEGTPETAAEAEKVGRIMPILQSAVQPILEEMKKTVSFYEQKTGRKVKKIFLAGGSAALPQMDSYLGDNLGLPVEVGKSWLDLPIDSGKINPILLATAAGLALRGIEKDSASADVNLLSFEAPEILKNIKFKGISRLIGNFYAKYGWKIRFFNFSEWILAFKKYRRFFFLLLILAAFFAFYYSTRLLLNYSKIFWLLMNSFDEAANAVKPALNLLNIGIGKQRLPGADFVSFQNSALASLFQLFQKLFQGMDIREWLGRSAEATQAGAGYLGSGIANFFGAIWRFWQFVYLRFILAAAKWLTLLIFDVIDFFKF